MVYAYQKTPLKVSPKVGSILAMGAMMYAEYFWPVIGYKEGYHRQLPDGTDIIKEYELIQQKKSSLSKWERDAVVRIFENTYTPCE